jgi:hypothetical protein
MGLYLKPGALKHQVQLKRLAFHLNPMLSDQTVLKGLLGFFPNFRAFEALCGCGIKELGAMMTDDNQFGVHEATRMIFRTHGSNPHLEELTLKSKLLTVGLGPWRISSDLSRFRVYPHF